MGRDKKHLHEWSHNIIVDAVPVLLRREETGGKVLVFGVFAKISVDGRLYKAGLLYVSPLKSYLSLTRKIYVSLRAEDSGVGIGGWKPFRVEERAYRMLAAKDSVYGTVYSPVSSHLRLQVGTDSLRIYPEDRSLRFDATENTLRKKVITGLLRI